MVSGRTLQVDTSNIQDIDGLGEFQYSWFNSADGISWQEIDGEDAAAYTLTSNDVSRYIKVKTKFVDQQGFFEEFSKHSGRTVLGGVDGREPGKPIIGGVDEDYIDGTQTDDDVIAGGDDRVITGQGSMLLMAGLVMTSFTLRLMESGQVDLPQHVLQPIWMALPSSLKKSRLEGRTDSLTLSMAMQISTPSF